jgi:dipeptidyl aminopeptidase/acylaminoacyl peptidase
MMGMSGFFAARMRRARWVSAGAFALIAGTFLLPANVEPARAQSAAAPAAAPATTLADPAAAFGARESILSIRLSPNGSRIAYVAPTRGQGAGLYVVDLASGESTVAATADGEHQRLGGCGWVSDARLVCSVYVVQRVEGFITTASRLIALDADGRNIQQLGERDSAYQRYARFFGGAVIDWLPGEDGAILLGQQFVPEQRVNTRLERRENGYGVVRVDTRSLGRRTVVDPNPQAIDYVSDGQGTIRIMAVQPTRGETGQLSNEIRYMYRAAGSNAWNDFGAYNVLTRQGPAPAAVDRTLNAAYVFDTLNGRRALYRVALDGSNRRELLVSNDQVDIDDLIRVGRSRRVVGASFVTERRQAVMFDPALSALTEQLSHAIPNLPQIRVVDTSADESKLLIWAGADTDAGRYFIYDKGSRRLDEIMLARPQLEGVTLAPMRSVTYRAADGTMIPAYLTLPAGSDGRGLPAIVMPHGGPGARDEWGFDWLAQYYANRGFAVLQPNFRGSEGYGDAWFQQNGFQSWRTAVGDVNDAGRWLVSQGIANPARLAIVGWSYGGYAALQSSVLDPNLFKAVVAIAPVTDLNLLKEEYRYSNGFAQARDFIGSGAHIREGSPAQNAAAIHAPVMIFHGDLDGNVGVAQSRLMRDRLSGAGRQVELVVFPGLDHQLDDSDARARMLRESDAFLRRSLGMQ